ncbi:DUF4245 domain-containing protein [Protaetiibacter sp. SSC-01]|nr:DUF4245 domain-containing protein [Protaetiibacter sp. SSC-01]
MDESGRPIVAELGRAETPEEMAARKAATSQKHRSSQTARNLFAAVIASLGIVAFLVMVVVRPDQGSLREPADYLGAAADLQASVEVPIVAPPMPDAWYANHAGKETRSDGVLTWKVGFTTPEDKYLAIIQGVDANPSWTADQVRDARAGAVITIDGVQWTIFDRRDSDDPGNVAYALVTEADGSTIVLAGTAGDEEFAALAAAVAKELS